MTSTLTFADGRGRVELTAGGSVVRELTTHRVAAVERDGSSSAPSPKPNAPALNTGLDAK